MNHEDDGRFEPTRFVWVYDGLLVAGELGDWAKAWEADYYGGDFPPPLDVVTWDGEGEPVKHRISVRPGEASEGAYIPWTITVPGLHDIAIVTIDGRA